MRRILRIISPSGAQNTAQGHGEEVSDLASINEKVGGYMLANSVGKHEFARMVGLDPRQFDKRLKGEIDWRLSELGRIAEIVGCSIDDLVMTEGRD